ncbi:MAG: aminodeoxychorismate synthase component I [Candidatus Omnitrophica bacterium]|nr:aminodeoxychorismate synthase component I [Candidatus Omnitrophota bacterium]
MAYLVWKSYNFNRDVWPVFAAVKEKRNCFFLDSCIRGSLGRYSFLGFEPNYILGLKDKGSLDTLRRILKEHKVKSIQNAPPFLCGAVGFLTYDFGLLLEDKLKSLAHGRCGLPVGYFAFYDGVIAIDHWQKKLFIIALNQSAFKKISRALQGMNYNKMIEEQEKRKNTPALICPAAKNYNYKKAVKKAKDYIAKGDIYQVNLAQKFLAKSSLAADEIFQRLRKASPASFSAYLDCGNFQVISSSPERFLSLRDRKVQARPMKGTRPRAKDKQKDEHLKRELLNSVKDKAELVMIVDLMRNDLGRVCEYSSVRVSAIRNLEKYKTVFQTTASIEGTLHKDRDGIDLLKACFPGGSITGCPKIRSMEIIHELEPFRRGIYTGSLGYFSYSGNLDFNILIRTILKQGNDLSFCVGSGIVADSQPEAEYAETLVKAEGILRAIS